MPIRSSTEGACAKFCPFYEGARAGRLVAHAFDGKKRNVDLK